MPRRTPPRLLALALVTTLTTIGLAGAEVAPAVILDPPAPSVLPLPPQPVPAPLALERPISVDEFARLVDPRPGHYDVLFCHPYTGEPVRACFDLPEGCPRVCVKKRLLFYVLEFDYGRCQVEVKFGCKGRVRVNY